LHLEGVVAFGRIQAKFSQWAKVEITLAPVRSAELRLAPLNYLKSGANSTFEVIKWIAKA